MSKIDDEIAEEEAEKAFGCLISVVILLIAAIVVSALIKTLFWVWS